MWLSYLVAWDCSSRLAKEVVLTTPNAIPCCEISQLSFESTIFLLMSAYYLMHCINQQQTPGPFTDILIEYDLAELK